MQPPEGEGMEYWNPELWMVPAVLADRAAKAPEQENRLGPLRSGQVGWIAAPPGVGKSMFALAIACAIAEGKSLAGWPGSGEVNQVKLIDAELTDRALYARLESTATDGIPEALLFNTWGVRETLGADSFSLGDPEHQLWLMQTARGAEVVIVDNVTFTLDPAPGGNMYSPETINQLKPLLSWAHNTNRLLILIDHTNAQGQLAGSLQKQRMADWVVLLDRDECVGDMDLAFTLKWDKYRDDDGPKAGAQEAWTMTKNKGWESRTILGLNEQIKELIVEGLDAKDIAKELDCSAQYVRRVKKRG
jgi:hypothetical protein